MILDTTERSVSLHVEEGHLVDSKQLVSELEASGFVVKMVLERAEKEPRLVTDVGQFVGLRSIRGFIKGYRKIFEIAHELADELSR